MPNAHFKRWEGYDHREAEGAAAAQEGKTREDCPYDEEAEPDAWNFWVYGNANEQGAMIKRFMDAEGEPTFYMTTAALTPEMSERLREWGEKCNDANRRMRSARGWKLPS